MEQRDRQPNAQPLGAPLVVILARIASRKTVPATERTHTRALITPLPEIDLPFSVLPFFFHPLVEVNSPFCIPRLGPAIHIQNKGSTRVKSWACFLEVGLTCFLTAASPVVQREIFVPSSDVSFKISTVQTSYKVGNSIALKYRVKNISNAALFVPREWEAICPANPHMWAWLEDSRGKRFVPGYAGDCSPRPQTIRERMSKEAILLKPGEHLDGAFLLETKLLGGLRPGVYRVEAALTGWIEEKFTDVERSQLARMASPFMKGEASDSIRIMLLDSAK
jgi:hypothetical protein